MGAITPSCGLLDVPAEILHEICASPREYYALIRTCKHLWHAYTQNEGTLAWVAAKHFPDSKQLHPGLSHYQRYTALRLTDQNFRNQVYTSHTLKGHTGYFRTLVACPDGRLAALLNNSTIAIWDREYKYITTLPNEGVITSAFAAFPGGGLVSGTHYPGRIKIWDSANQCITTFKGHTGSINALATFLDGCFASCSSDATIKIWSSEYVCTATMQAMARALVACPNGHLAAFLTDNTVMIWDTAGAPIATFDNNVFRSVKIFTGLSSGQLISDESEYLGKINIWNIESGKCIASLTDDSSLAWADCFGLVDDAFAVYQNGHLVSAAKDGTVGIWNIENGKRIATFNSFNGGLAAMAVFQDGRLALVKKESNRDAWDEKLTEIRDFRSNLNDVWVEIVKLLSYQGEEISKDTMARFSRMPPYAQKLIYVELAKILNLSSLGQDPIVCGENAFWGRAGQNSTPQQRVDAILAYLNNQGVQVEIPRWATNWATNPGVQVELPRQPITQDAQVELPSHPITQGVQVELPRQPITQDAQVELPRQPINPGVQVEPPRQPINPGVQVEPYRPLAQRITDFVFTLFTTAWDWVRYGLHCLTCWQFAVAPVEAMPGAPPAAPPLRAPVLAG